MKRKFKVTYRTPDTAEGYAVNYVEIRARSPREAVEERLTLLGGWSSCADDAWFECDGERYDIKWDSDAWGLKLASDDTLAEEQAR